jgi:2-dehydro-3-deoxygluconokinase
MRVVTFGEVMLRMAPAEFLRLRQVIPGTLDVTFGGGEVNVAVSVALQGGQSAFLTALPDNPLTDAFEQELRKLNVGTDLVQRGRGAQEGRFGIYFVETGANQRGGTVTYDREHSSIAITPAEAYNWEKAYTGADWLHITGITPALSATSAAAALAAVQQAKARKLTVSCDLNFRKKLWKWQPGTSASALAQETMRRLLPHIDVVIANEEDADLALGIRAEGTDVEAGEVNVGAYEQVARQIVAQFPNVSKVAITLRESISASHNNWGALLYDARTQRIHVAPTDAAGHYASYEIHNIVDRVGAGDSFAGGRESGNPFLSNGSSGTFSEETGSMVQAGCLERSCSAPFQRSARLMLKQFQFTPRERT